MVGAEFSIGLVGVYVLLGAGWLQGLAPVTGAAGITGGTTGATVGATGVSSKKGTLFPCMSLLSAADVTIAGVTDATKVSTCGCGISGAALGATFGVGAL